MLIIIHTSSLAKTDRERWETIKSESISLLLNTNNNKNGPLIHTSLATISTLMILSMERDFSHKLIEPEDRNRAELIRL